MSKDLKLRIGNHTDKGMVRKVNQDSFGSVKSDWGKLYVVADGMGGHKGGETASKMIVDHLCQKFEKDKGDNPLNFLNDVIIEANSIVMKKAEEEKELEGMGSTVVAVIISNTNSYIAHVGDSRCYLFRHKTPYQLTKDHSVVQKMFDEGVIDVEDMETHPRKNEILQAVGIGEVKPSLRSEPLYKGDILLLCSDGLSGEVSSKEMLSLIKQKDLMSSAKKLIAMANERGGPDNSTVVLVSVDSGSKPSKNAIPAPIMKVKPVKKTPKKKSKPTPMLKGIAIGFIAAIVLVLVSFQLFLFFNKKPKSPFPDRYPKPMGKLLDRDSTNVVPDSVSVEQDSILKELDSTESIETKMIDSTQSLKDSTKK
jgi:protein phosphatase